MTTSKSYFFLSRFQIIGGTKQHKAITLYSQINNLSKLSSLVGLYNVLAFSKATRRNKATMDARNMNLTVERQFVSKTKPNQTKPKYTHTHKGCQLTVLHKKVQQQYYSIQFIWWEREITLTIVASSCTQTWHYSTTRCHLFHSRWTYEPWRWRIVALHCTRLRTKSYISYGPK